MAKLLDLSVHGPGHISNILQVDASVYAKAFVTDGGKDTQVVRGDGTLASISSLYVGNAATASSAPWSGITGKPTTFTPSAHTHTASDITGLPTSLKNPYKLTFGSKTYDGSAAATITASDLGALTSITKPMIEGVLTGNITSHTHSQYLTSALRPAKLFTRESMFPPGYFIITINNNNSKWILSFDVKIVVSNGSYTIRFSEDNRSKSESWSSPSASMIDGEDSVKVKFGYSRTNKWVAITATDSFAGVSITNVANGYAPIDTYALDKLFTINFFDDWGVLEGDDSGLEYLGTVQETITIYPPSKEGHTHTFASLTSKPTTINGYGITDALTTSNYNSYVPTRTGTGASGTWGISISGNATTATNAPWSGITGKPSTFTPSAHTHTASEISGLPTALSAFNNDVGYLTGITKSMVEGVLTGDISSHTHSYLPLSGGIITPNKSGYREGIRIKPFDTWVTIFLGGGDEGEYGTSAKSWSIHNNAGTFYIANNGSYSFSNGLSWTTDGNLNIKSSSSFTYNSNPILHFGNYNSYAPTLTGTGASGTWGISISGNAASADYATSAGLLKLVANQNPDTSSIGQIFTTSYNEGIPSGGYAYLSGITLASNNDANYKVQLGLDYYGKVFSRWQATGTWRDWNRLAFITDNVASATKLKTPRTLWGQSFDGTGNVSGEALIGEVLIGRNGNVIDGWRSGNDVLDLFLNFNSTKNVIACYNGGNVIIGNRSDSGARLQVAGSTLIDRGDNGGVLIGRNGNTIDGYINGSLTELHLNYASPSNIYMCHGGGNVSIGTSANSGYKLQVNGSTNVTTLYENGTRVSLTGHTHDDRYYTESEVDTKLSGKSDTGHTHTKSQITDFPTSMPASDVYSWAKASTKPTYTYSEVGAAPASHSHATLANNLYSISTDINFNHMIWTANSSCSDNTTMSYAALLNVGTDLYRGWQIWNSRNDHQLYWRPAKSNGGSWAENHIIIDSNNIRSYALTSLPSHTHTKSQITDFPSSMPASDVYAWAKASTKPTYTYSEVGAAAASHTHNYAGSSSAGGAATSVVVTDSNANSTYRMVWHSGNTLYGTAGIYCNPSTDSIYASAFYETSDERLKDFENSVNVDLNLIRSIPKMYFRWKKNPNKLQIGTSAQAVKQIYPELVSSSEDDILSVDYSKLSIVALSAIDKLHLENQDLKHEINLLKQEIEKLKGQI